MFSGSTSIRMGSHGCQLKESKLRGLALLCSDGPVLVCRTIRSSRGTLSLCGRRCEKSPYLGSWVELVRSGECAEELVDPGGSFGLLWMLVGLSGGQ